MRTFVAIEVNNKDVLNSIHKIQAELNIKAKPVELHNMHFTVQFLGEVSEDMVRLEQMMASMNLKNWQK